MNKHKQAVLEFKKLFREIIKTRFYQFLKGKYIPKVIKFEYDKNGRFKKDENGHRIIKPFPIIQLNVPDIEAMARSMLLFRQFILKGKKDLASIYNLGIHIKIIGSTQQYTQFLELKDEFDKYANYISGDHYRFSDKRQTTLIQKRFKYIDWFNELYYGGGRLAHYNIKDSVQLQDEGARNKIIEYFLGFMIILCRIGMIFKFPELNDEIICKKHCPFKVYNGKDSPVNNPDTCKAIPIPPYKIYQQMEIDPENHSINLQNKFIIRAENEDLVFFQN